MSYKIVGDGVRNLTTGAFITEGSPGWAEYQEWLQTNTPDPELTLAEAKELCIGKAMAEYYEALEQPINDGTDDIICVTKARGKINNAKHSTKTTLKAQKADGRPKSYTVTEMEDLIDAIDDRDDLLLDGLETTLDAIDDAETLAELAPYWPPDV